MKNQLSYENVGVNINVANAAKATMSESLKTTNPRVLNRFGAFASLFDGKFPEYEDPVLVLKTEEPGSKQKLAFQHNRISSICYDMINHLVNDIIVMGAKPLAVQDAIISGKLDEKIVTQIVDSISNACKEQDCVLTGGETSEQPGVISDGTYILTSSIVGIVEKAKVIDGSKIKKGDCVLAVPSNGLHTNGYSLVRALITNQPEILEDKVEGESFLDAILRPHKCYYKCFQGLFDMPSIHGIAHITGGGIAGNLNRILPNGLNASIDLSKIRILPVFKIIRERGSVADADMLQTFNMGIGMVIVAKKTAIDKIQNHLRSKDCDSYLIGEIVEGEKKVIYRDNLNF